MDSLTEIWNAQEKQQRELGIEPSSLSSLEKRAVLSDLLLSLHEEVSEVQRTSTDGYKRHLLNGAQYVVDKHNVAIEIVDSVKLLIAIAQLMGITEDEFFVEFMEKTKVVKALAESEWTSVKDSMVLCVDMDDVICDMAVWHEEEKIARGDAPPGVDRHTAEEEWKDKWFKSGRFRELPPVPDALKVLRIVKFWGWKVVVITARPQSKYSRIHADTLHWFEKHGFDPDLILFGKDKVELIHTYIKPAWPVYFIEDHERNARALSAAGIEVLLFDRPKNRGMETMHGVTRVHSWNEILDKLTNKATDKANKQNGK